MTEDFYKVLCYCHRWDVPVSLVNELPPIGKTGSLSPTSHFKIHWTEDDRRIYARTTTRAQELLHELAHCLNNTAPDWTDEVYDSMLAFEYYSTRHLKISGRKDWMRDFGLGPGVFDWGYTSTKVRSQFLKDSLAEAVKLGLLTKDGKPTFMNPFRKENAA